MSILNMGKSYDTKKDILETLVEECHNEHLSDNDFADVCVAYGMEESDVMDKMITSEKYKFRRIGMGWDVTEL